MVFRVKELFSTMQLSLAKRIWYPFFLQQERKLRPEIRLNEYVCIYVCMYEYVKYPINVFIYVRMYVCLNNVFAYNVFALNALQLTISTTYVCMYVCMYVCAALG